MIIYTDRSIEEAIEMIKRGEVNKMAFGGLPMSLIGSLSIGKYVALANKSPVISVHVGHGDLGFYTHGPYTFSFVRSFNRGLIPHFDPVLGQVIQT